MRYATPIALIPTLQKIMMNLRDFFRHSDGYTWPRNYMFVAMLAVFVYGCGGGGGGGSSGGGGSTGVQMGGAIQGTPLTLAGNVTTLAGTPAMADGAGAAANFNRPAHVVSDGTYLYIADSRNGVIRRHDIATGVTSTLAGRAAYLGTTDGIGSAARFISPFGITLHSGSLYVTDMDVVRKIVIATGEVSTLATTNGSFIGSVALTAAGDSLFIADYIGDRILRVVVATGVVTTFAGNGSSGLVDGVGTAARFQFPGAITATSNGATLFVHDNFSHIRRIDVATATVTTVATSNNLANVRGMATDDTSLYVTSAANYVRQVSIATGAVTTLAGNGTPGSADGDFNLARFYYPLGVTHVAQRLYVIEAEGHTVRKLDLVAGTISTVASIAAYTDGVAAAARLSDVFHTATDGTHLYLAGYGGNIIRRVTIATGEVTTIAGLAGTAGSTDGVGSAARFISPFGITTDGTSLYVTAGNVIRKVVIANRQVTTLAGDSRFFGSTDGIGTAARFAGPTGITTDGTHLYVADFNNHTIRKVVISTGEVTTLAGLAGAPGLVDGTGNNARLESPIGVTTDGTYVYVTNGTATIRRIAISDGTVSTLSLSGDTLFTLAVGVTTDGTNLYISTYTEQRIRKIVLATGVISTIAGRSSDPDEVDGDATTARFWMPYGITTDGSRLFVIDQWGLTVRVVQ